MKGNRNTILNWLVSALVLWGLSFLPFMNMRFEGLLSIVIVAVVLGLINAIIVRAVKNMFKRNRSRSSLIVGIVSIVIDALAIWLAAVLVRGFSLGSFVTAIIAAVILSFVNIGFSASEK